MSTGMEMQRLSRGAEGVSRDVGFTGSPGGSRTRIRGEELREPEEEVCLESLEPRD
jgi:hypothetical protein